MEIGPAEWRVLLRIQIFVVYLAALGHAISKFGLPSRSTPANVLQSCRAALTRLRGSLFGAEPAPVGGLDPAVRDRLHDFRMQLGRILIHRVAEFTGVTLLVAVLIVEFSGKVDDEAFAQLLLKALTNYGMMLTVVCGCVPHTAATRHIACAYVYGMWMVFVLQMQDDPTFFSNLGIRTISRTAMGLAYLDWRKAFWWNVACSMVTCWQYQCNVSVIQQPGDPQVAWVYFIGTETWTLLILMAGLYYVEQWLESRLRLQIVAENQSNASLRLLGFQCDAVFWLTPELRVDGPAEQLAHFLLLDDARDHLADRDFERYIFDDGDRQRFRDFIATAIATHQPDTPPAMLHMNLRDATSTRTSVDVFHVHCIDLQDKERHLIGIKENAANEAQHQREEPAHDEVQRQHDDPEVERQQYEEARNEFQRQAQGHEAHVQLIGRPLHGDRPLHDDNEGQRQPSNPSPRRRDTQAEPSLPSVPENTCPSTPSVEDMILNRPPSHVPRERTQLPSSIEEVFASAVSDIVFHIDALSQDLPVSECTFFFKSAGHARAPELLQLLAASCADRFVRWIEANTNCAVYGLQPQGSELDPGQLVLQFAGTDISIESTQIAFPRTITDGQSGRAMVVMQGASLLRPDPESAVTELTIDL